MYFSVSLLLPWWQFPLRDALLNQGCPGQWKRDIFWRGKMYRICFFHFVIYSGNFFFPVALYFSSEWKETSAGWFLWCNSHSSKFIFFFMLYIQSSRSDLFIKYKQTVFLSKVSTVICVCLTGPRRFWFVQESAAVSYSDFIWPALLWQAGAGNSLSLSHQNIPL